ncbi:hypothetical protein [Sphingosinicella terrae]|uniref:hypothetical protein n=1 Tax=Sphingosinicella terrae TaxID=2172047 RepID=UPI000E0DE62D|nr:hypothetical protein [Sphingosinicella terrae]
MDRAERTGFGVAFVGHAAILAALIWLGRPNSEAPQTKAFEVSFVDEVGLTSAAPMPTQQPAAAATAPEAGPVDDSAAAPAPAEAAPPVPDPRPVPEQPALTRQPRTRPEPPRQQPTRPITRQTRSEPKQTRPSESGTGERSRRPLIGDDILKGIGDDRQSRSNAPPAEVPGAARASINAAIRRALIPCERQPLPAPEAGAIKVNVRVQLNRDGSLADATVTRVINDDPGLRNYERRMRDLALSIVRGCTPIRGLPAEYYDAPRGWRQFTYQFDPRQS